MEKYSFFEEKKYAGKTDWDTAIGLQDVDGLRPSKYLLELASDNISKKISLKEINDILYKRKSDNQYDEEEIKQRVIEADLVSTRIAGLLSEKSFSFKPVELQRIHEILFTDIYAHAGVIRTLNLTKEESILNGETVQYADYSAIRRNMDYDFENISKVSFLELEERAVIEKITGFISNIWQTHAFMEGNTRTVAVFTEKWLNANGFEIDNSLFALKAQYFRNALVRANYADYKRGIDYNYKFIEKFFENLLFKGTHELTNKELICFELFPDKETKKESDDKDCR